MARSTRVMFLSLIAALLAAVVTLHAKNTQLAQGASSSAGAPR